MSNDFVEEDILEALDGERENCDTGGEDLIEFGERCLRAIEAVRGMNGGNGGV